MRGNKQKQQKKPQQKRKRARKGRKVPTRVDHALALANPFHPDAGTHRWPDSAGVASVALQLRDFVPITPVLDGELSGVYTAGVSIAPDPAACVRRIGATTSGAISFNSGLPLPLWNSDDWKSYRITSFGVKLHCLLSDANNGGTLIAQEGVMEPVTETSDYYGRGTLSAVKQGGVAIGRPAGTGARAFAPTSGAVEDWAYATIIATNLAATSGAAFMAEVVMNVEAIPNAGRLSEKLATKVDKADLEAVDLSNQFLAMSTPQMLAVSASFLVEAAARYFTSRAARTAQYFPRQQLDFAPAQ